MGLLHNSTECRSKSFLDGTLIKRPFGQEEYNVSIPPSEQSVSWVLTMIIANTLQLVPYNTRQCLGMSIERLDNIQVEGKGKSPYIRGFFKLLSNANVENRSVRPEPAVLLRSFLCHLTNKKSVAIK